MPVLINISKQTAEPLRDLLVCVCSAVLGAAGELSAMFTWRDPQFPLPSQGLSLVVSLFASASLALIWLSLLVDST